MIPFQSILTPLFLILTKLGLHNTLTGLVLRLCDAAAAVLGLHDAQRLRRRAAEIEEAARIDGANDVTMLLQGDAAAGLAGRRHRRAVRLPRRLERVPGGAGAADRPVQIHAAGHDDRASAPAASAPSTGARCRPASP